MGFIGGIGQQQAALALELDLERLSDDLLDDEIKLDDEIDEELEDLIPPEAAAGPPFPDNCRLPPCPWEEEDDTTEQTRAIPCYLFPQGSYRWHLCRLT